MGISFKTNEMSVPIAIQEKFVDFLTGAQKTEDFEAWLYADDELECILGQENYLELISFDFKQKSANTRIKPLLEKHIDYSKYETQWILNLIEANRVNSKPCQNNLKTTYQLYCSGYAFMDNLGLGYGLRLASAYEYGVDIWEDIEESKRNEIVQGFYPQLREEAEKVIHWLESGKVKLTGEEDERGRLEYVDNRTDDEKKPTAYSREE